MSDSLWRQASLSITNSWTLLKLMSIELVMPSNHLILCHPLLLLPSIFPNIRVISNESVLCIRWPKYWSFSFSISPSNVYSGLISFRMDWLGLLAVQGTLKGLLQHHSSKAPILQRSTFFIVQLSHPCMTAGKTIALTRLTLVSKIMSLFFNMLSRLFIAFLPRNKCLNFMAAITICSDFGAPKNKVSRCFHYFPIYFPWSEYHCIHDIASWNWWLGSDNYIYPKKKIIITQVAPSTLWLGILDCPVHKVYFLLYITAGDSIALTLCHDIKIPFPQSP